MSTCLSVLAWLLLTQAIQVSSRQIPECVCVEELPGSRGIRNPTVIRSISGDDGRMYVGEHIGAIQIIENGGVLSEPYLDISDRVSTNWEMGFLGFEFHPDYVTNGRMFVTYSHVAETEQLYTRLSEFQRDEDNPDQADPESERILLEIEGITAIHHGGDVRML